MIADDPYRYQREKMVDSLRRAGVADERVLGAMREVPRHLFVPPEWRREAYNNAAIAIGHGQTISQPLVVARMTEAAALDPQDRVLEIGTGSGYQAAVLAHLVRFVFTVERIPQLADQAKHRLDRLGVENVSVKVMDGTLGWSGQAPFDAILVTAGAPEVPEPLLAQLADGGRLVIPIGDQDNQHLLLLRRHGGRFQRRNLGGANFVPLVGRFGWHGEGRGR